MLGSQQALLCVQLLVLAALYCTGCWIEVMSPMGQFGNIGSVSIGKHHTLVYGHFSRCPETSA